ncbi:HAD-IA family hydrolase [Candidatus Daviesbacteria bacterium]|nr:HAD-IA family hydrolase [Candidatus Daviesbacteria bacterium]
MKKAILFDIDGTLLDAGDFVFRARDYTLKFHGHNPSEEKIKAAMGIPLVEFYQIVVPEADALKLAQTHMEFQENNFQLIKPYPKTLTTLKALKAAGFVMAAVSNRTRDSLLRSLKMTKVYKYLDAVFSAEDVKNPKPHKEHVLVTLKALKVEPVNAYMVGDTEHDITAGREAKVKTVGVLYGWRGEDIKKCNPDFVIDDIEEILNIVK